jgi:hypothetical protein
MSSPETARSPLDEFLNPKSMLTPGLAGALTMLITNTLATQFGLWPNYTGLLISFLFGSLVFLSQSTVSWLGRFLYYLLNSLVIFSVAMGANQAGITAATRMPHQGATKDSDQKLAATYPFFSYWLDGTVPLRKRLIKDINTQLAPDRATIALWELGVQNAGEDPVHEVRQVAANSRSAYEVARVNTAIARASNPTFAAWYATARAAGSGEAISADAY